MADLREDFVSYVVKALVANPNAVILKRSTDDKGDFLELTVDPSDMGKVIGRAGATAKSIRTLLRVVGAKDDLPPLALKIVEPEGVEVPPEADAQPEEEAVAEASDEDEHAQRHAQTRKEMEELADLEL